MPLADFVELYLFGLKKVGEWGRTSVRLNRTHVVHKLVMHGHTVSVSESHQTQFEEKKTKQNTEKAAQGFMAWFVQGSVSFASLLTDIENCWPPPQYHYFTFTLHLVSFVTVSINIVTTFYFIRFHVYVCCGLQCVACWHTSAGLLVSSSCRELKEETDLNTKPSVQGM